MVASCCFVALLLALSTATLRAQTVTKLIAPPGYHAWPRTEQSQDISGPIGIVDPTTNHTTWHIFIDCSVTTQGDGGSNLAWCHMHSSDLFTWTEDPIAMRRGPHGSPDATGLDTGSVFQHPNGTVYAVYEACNQTFNFTARVAMEGDICYARAKDTTLIEWEKLCYASGSAAAGGRITNPVCSWCRADCPARCGPTRPVGPSPFPEIMALQPFRDPPAPWLHNCSATSSELCWWQPVASGGLSPPGEPAGQPTLLMWKNDLEMSGPWEFAVPGRVVNESTVWWGNGHPGHTLSCPDVFQPPQPKHAGPALTVFTSLYDNYVLGTLNPATQLLEAIPPFSHTSALPLSGPGLSIMKSGGVGPSNSNNARSRRLYFGTVGLPPGCGIIVAGGVHGFRGNHTGFIPTLPRDLTIAQLHKPTAKDVGYRLLNAFVPELQGLRIASSHSHTRHVAPNSTIQTGSNNLVEILAVFGAHCANATPAYGVRVMGGALSVGTDSSGVPSKLDLAAVHDDGRVFVHVFVDSAFVEGSVGNQSIVILSSDAVATEAMVYGCDAESVDVWMLRNITDA